jgi:hypothetical protein
VQRAHLLWKTLLIDQDETAAERAYREELGLPLNRLRAIERRSSSLLDDMTLMNELFSGAAFPKKDRSRTKALAIRAKEWRERLRPKRSLGRPTYPRRHFFVSGILPYIKWKPVAFLERKKEGQVEKIWDWLSGWTEWIETLEVRNRKDLLKLPRKSLYPAQISERLLKIVERPARKSSTALNIRSWWQQSSDRAFHSVLAGSEAFLMWRDARLDAKGRMNYVKAVCRVLKGRGISERQLAGYPIGQVGAVLRTAKEYKDLARLMRRELPNLSAHAHTFGDTAKTTRPR